MVIACGVICLPEPTRYGPGVQYAPTLDIENFGLEKSDLDTIFQAGNNIGIGAATLRDIIAHLESTYCDSIGVEYAYLRDPAVIQWLRARMEGSKNSKRRFTAEERKHIFFH
jgi:2-oxoglutarate dehydrogenase E1 component